MAHEDHLRHEPQQWRSERDVLCGEQADAQALTGAFTPRGGGKGGFRAWW
ncbi:hypothetical protein [Actinopolyspora mzabensis]|nr:hypothetical protein [Actinopolyspora mzabensis]